MWIRKTIDRRLQIDIYFYVYISSFYGKMTWFDFLFN
jgi:hypothetical protein